MGKSIASEIRLPIQTSCLTHEWLDFLRCKLRLTIAFHPIGVVRIKRENVCED